MKVTKLDCLIDQLWYGTIHPANLNNKFRWRQYSKAVEYLKVKVYRKEQDFLFRKELELEIDKLIEQWGFLEDKEFTAEKKIELKQYFEAMNEDKLQETIKITNLQSKIRKARYNIQDFINKNGYTYTVQDILDDYKTDYINGKYICYSMTQCIKYLEQDIKAMLLIK